MTSPETNVPAGAQSAPAGAPAAAPKAGRKPTRPVDAIVTSARMQKTISVEMSRLERHPKYGKYVRRYIRLKVHDEKGEAREGDVVRIVQTRPLSKTKRWRLVEVIKKARR